MVEQRFGDLAAQLLQRFIALALQGAGGVEEASDLGTQLLFGGFDFGAAFARECVGVGLGQGLALGADECEHHVPALAGQAKLQSFGQGIQGGKGLRLLGFVGLFDALALGAEVGAVQALGNIGLQRARDLLHALAQQAPLSRRQAQGAGALGGVKVVQVAQVRWHRAQRRRLLHGLVQQCGAAAAHLAQHKQVVVRLLQPQAKTGGRLGALLANPGQGQVPQIGRAGKTQTVGGDAQAQLGRGKWDSGHGQKF